MHIELLSLKSCPAHLMNSHCREEEKEKAWEYIVISKWAGSNESSWLRSGLVQDLLTRLNLIFRIYLVLFYDLL